MDVLKTTLSFKDLAEDNLTGHSNGMRCSNLWVMIPRVKLYFELRSSQSISCSFWVGFLSTYLKESGYATPQEALRYMQYDKLSAANATELEKAVKRCVR